MTEQGKNGEGSSPPRRLPTPASVADEYLAAILDALRELRADQARALARNVLNGTVEIRGDPEKALAAVTAALETSPPGPDEIITQASPKKPGLLQRLTGR